MGKFLIGRFSMGGIFLEVEIPEGGEFYNGIFPRGGFNWGEFFLKLLLSNLC